MIFDTHAHYDDKAFDEDREEILAALHPAGIGLAADVAASRDSLERVLSLAHGHDFIYAVLGLHPDYASELDEETIACLERDLADPKVVAVGEIGLDYYWNKASREVQAAAFRTQIDLALSRRMPIVIHSREAAQDTLAIVREKYGRGTAGAALEQKGVMHCYSYSVEQARIYTRELGFYLGIGGVVTFKNARKLKEVVADTDLDFLVLETDCPYLAPVPFRGKRNSSLLLPYVVRAIAEIKGVTPEEVEARTEANARRMYGLDGRQSRVPGPGSKG